MWWTPDGDRILQGAEAQFFREAISLTATYKPESISCRSCVEWLPFSTEGNVGTPRGLTARMRPRKGPVAVGSRATDSTTGLGRQGRLLVQPL
jgi:hypothetical protein